MRARAAAVAFIALVALSATGLLSAHPARAQIPATASAPEAAAPAKKIPEPIAHGLVGVRASELDTRLRNMRTSLQDASVVDEIAEDVGPLIEAIGVQELELQRRLSGVFVESDLTALSARWQEVRRRIVAMEASLSRQAAKQEAAIEEVAFRIETWRLTRSSLGTGSSRETVLRDVSSTLDILKEANVALDEARSRVLVEQERLRSARARVDDALETLSAARAGRRAQLFERQLPPIWQMDLPDSFEENLAAFRMRLGHAWLDLESYLELRGARLVEQALLIVLSFVVVLRIRKRAPEELEPDDVLRHPMAAALLLALAAGVRLHPDAPALLRLFQTLLLLPPWFVLMRGVLPDWLGRPVIGLTVLLVFRLGYRFLTDLVWFSNWVLIFILAASFAGMLWLTRPARLEALPTLARGPWLRLLSLWTRTLVFLFGIGLGAAVFGYRALAEQLSYVAVWGSFVAMVMAALVRIGERIVEVAVDTGALDGLELVRSDHARCKALAARLLRVGGLVLWAWLTLHDASLAEPLADALSPWLRAKIGYGTFLFSVGGLLAFGATLWLFWWGSRFLAAVVEHEVFSRLDTEPGVAYAAASFARYALLTFGFLAAMSMMGVPLENVTLLISALGVGIGFGLQTVVNNFVSGIILLVERPVRVGDRVQIDSLFGEVRQIGIRASRVRTFDGSDVIVPNSEFVSLQVTNWTLSDRKRRISLPVGVAYGTDPERVIEILLKIARDNPEILAFPEPEALFRGFGDSALDFELRVFTESFRGFMPVSSDLAVAINAAFRDEGIQIPFPQRDLHLRSSAPEIGAGAGSAPASSAPTPKSPKPAEEPESDQ